MAMKAPRDEYSDSSDAHAGTIRADAIDEARPDHPVGVLGGALEGGAEDGPKRAQADGCDSAEAVARSAAQEAAEERAEVVDGDDAALEEGVGDDGLAGGVDVAEVHELDVVVGFVDAAHHPLVIACIE